MIKIAFFDIDGTLIGMKENGMTPAMKETLLTLKNNGIRIVIATGRLATMIPDMAGVEFDAYITFNGSHCFNKDEVIFHSSFTPEDVKTMLHNSQTYHLPIVASALVNRYRSEDVNNDLSSYYPDSAVVRDNTIDEEIVQFMVSCRTENYKEILRDTRHARVTDWQGKTADIYPDNSGKDVGVQKVLEYFGLTAENAIVFGDGNNDLAMFKAVSTSVAMGNATERLKEIADYICPSVYEDGITVFCKEHHLI